VIMHDSTKAIWKEVESPSAMLKGFSNTPQPKPDRGQARSQAMVSSGNAALNLALEVGLMKSQKQLREADAKFLHPQHLTIARAFPRVLLASPLQALSS